MALLSVRVTATLPASLPASAQPGVAQAVRVNPGTVAAIHLTV